MYDTETNERFPINGLIKLGNYNYIGSDVSIKQYTITPDFCTIASYSLCNKDYSMQGKNILIGGIPAKLLKLTSLEIGKGKIQIRECTNT